MILPVISGLVLVRKRVMTEIFPPSLRRIWKQWELKVVIFLSLISQITLISLGNRRKYIPRTWIKIFVWSAYLLADSVATLGLGILLNDMGDVYDNGGYVDATTEISAFWAPFFLLHLGGPDTITAYSLEDNELYRRHAFDLFFQTIATIIIFLTAWNGSLLSILSIPMIIVGIMKYVERTWSLWLASNDKLRNSMLTTADPGPNYRKFMDEYCLKRDEGYSLEVLQMKDAENQLPSRVNVRTGSSQGGGERADKATDVDKCRKIIQGYELFNKFKCLFADLILGSRESDYSKSMLEGKDAPKNPFDVISVELGLIYDLLYTKATVIYSFWGIFRRVITTFLTLLVSTVFATYVYFNQRRYRTLDLCVTFLLLGIAIGLEIFAALVILFSDWSSWWFSTKYNHMHKRITTFSSSIKILAPALILPRWSNSLGQYNLLSYCLREKPGHRMLRLLRVEKIREKHRYKSFKKLEGETLNDLEELVFEYVKNKCQPKRGSDTNLRSLYIQRTIWIIERHTTNSNVIRSCAEVDFDETILIWHLATELCYYSSSKLELEDVNCKRSILLSRYMSYLLVMFPFLLPVGIGLIRFRDTCTEFTKFLAENKCIFGDKINQKDENNNIRDLRRKNACKELLKVETRIPPTKVKGDRSKSVLFDACSVASVLNAIEDTKEKWKTLKDIWIEILTYAASQSRGSQHARQLRRGGELLTHVWLLMAHYGMTEQFQISQGHARSRLHAR